MAKWITFDDWVLTQKKRHEEMNAPGWKIPENTHNIIKGIELDLEAVGFQLGVDMKMIVEIQ